MTGAKESRGVDMGVHTESEERAVLRGTISLVSQNLADKRSGIVRLAGLDLDEYVYNNLMKQYGTRIRNLENALSSPYFARIDFAEEGDGAEACYYIGKITVFDGGRIAVVDWRAPVSSVYYEGVLGKVSYVSPGGAVHGELRLKRQYQIENGELLSFQDIDITTNDRFLQDILSVSSDIRLKNIVSTIQSEQNRIIRADMKKPLIVQGVAGSGKTTVALHRIAYLAYTYEDSIKPEEFLILAPNKFLLDYVSGVLPDLGVDFVRQETVEEFAASVMGAKTGIAVSNAPYVTGPGGPADISKFKTGLGFKKAIDSYLRDFNASVLLDMDFTIGKHVLLKHGQLQKTFMDHEGRLSVAERVARLRLYLQKWMENNAEAVAGRVLAEGARAIDSLSRMSNEQKKSARKELIMAETDSMVKELRKGGKKTINDYLKKVRLATLWEHYKAVMDRDSVFAPFLDQESVLHMRKSFASRYRKRLAEHEDIPALMYMQYKIYGLGARFSLKHVIIDEAQDFGLFLFDALRQILGCESMTILGDLAQGIYPFRGLDSWESLNEAVFQGGAAMEHMRVSYRTTIEIMEEANKVLAKLGGRLNTGLALPAIRHGRAVAHIRAGDFSDALGIVTRLLAEYENEGHRNVAIICRTDGKSAAVHGFLSKSDIDARLLSQGSPAYEGGVNVMPSYLSKGLEFDAVVLVDADGGSYGDSDIDAKLLYVSMTRAMHRLDIIYEGELTGLLK